MRITNEILEKKVAILNMHSIKEYKLDFANGGVRLCKKSNDYGGLSDISERVSKTEMARILDAIINYITKEYN